MLEEKDDLLQSVESEEARPSAARMVESLRDTGYTFATAVADVVDNSVAAQATEVRIKLDQQFDGSSILLIADNGHGMDEAGVKLAMKYGSPPRSNSKSLGKFGMGLKTASTSQCRKLTLISCKDGKYNGRQWDLDVIKELDRWKLIQPDLEEYQEYISFLEDLTGGGNGTLVIWENIDRLLRSDVEGSGQKQIDNVSDELRIHLSGVYFNFLKEHDSFPRIKLKINESYLEPWDPFCRWLNEGGNNRLDIHKNELRVVEKVNGNEVEVGKFNLNVYILPIKNDLTQEELEHARYSLNNQGFHVFREGRMIVSGGWPHRMFVKEPHMNLIRVELDFDHELDSFFQIDIKKSRIDLPQSWRKVIKSILAPARNEANSRYRTGGKGKGENGNTLGNQHGRSSSAIGKHHDEVTSGSQIEGVDKSTGEAQVKNKYGVTTIKLRLDDNKDLVVQTSDSLQDGVLWMPGLIDNNKHAVFINQTHEFYKRFYLPNKDNSALILAMDALLWSLAEAELSVMSKAVKNNLEDMRVSVSRSLRTLAEELPEIDESENDTSI